MKYCSKCGKEIVDEAVVCPGCGCAVAPTATQAAPKQENPEDVVSVGLCILAALLPIFGIIYWPVKHRETPKKAQACGITAICAWVIYFIFLMSIGY